MNGIHPSIQDIRTKPIAMRIGLALLLLFALTAMLSTAMAQICAVGIMLVYLFAIGRDPAEWVRSYTVIDLVIPILVLSRIISVFFSVDLDASLQIFRTELPFYLLPFALLWLLKGSDESFLVLLTRLIILGALLAGIIGAATYLSGSFHRAVSTTSGWYTLGMFLTAAFGLSLGIGPRTEVFRSQWIWYLVLAILLVALLFTFNRIHWVIAGFLVLIVGILRDRMLLGVALGAGGLVVGVSEEIRTRFLTLLEPSAHLSDRDVIWREAIRLAGDKPLFGFGPKTFKTVFPEVSEAIDPGIASWHNDTLQFYLESGVVAAVCYVVLMLTPIWIGVVTLRKGGVKSHPYVLGYVLLVASIFLGGMTGIFFTDPIIAPLMYAGMAVLLRKTKMDRSN